MNVPLILALDTAGQPRQWITWEDAVVYHAKGLVAWQHGENDYTFMGGRSRMTGNQSSINTQSIIAIKGVEVGKTRKHEHKEPPITNRLLFRRDRNTCAYCGNPFHDSILTRDHIIPQSYGGKDTWTNLVAACKPCNNRKGDKLPGRAGMVLLFVPYVPSKNEYLILSNRRILADQMEYLMAGVGANSRLLEVNH